MQPKRKSVPCSLGDKFLEVIVKKLKSNLGNDTEGTIKSKVLPCPVFQLYFTDVETVQLLITKKPLEGTPLKISNPRVCNSILITGLAEKTSKQAIEMYFENEKNGGGKIYGDVIYQKDQGKAVVSFCDPKCKVDNICISKSFHHMHFT